MSDKFGGVASNISLSFSLSLTHIHKLTLTVLFFLLNLRDIRHENEIVHCNNGLLNHKTSAGKQVSEKCLAPSFKAKVGKRI